MNNHVFMYYSRIGFPGQAIREEVPELAYRDWRQEQELQEAAHLKKRYKSLNVSAREGRRGGIAGR